MSNIARESNCFFFLPNLLGEKNTKYEMTSYERRCNCPVDKATSAICTIYNDFNRQGCTTVSTSEPSILQSHNPRCAMQSTFYKEATKKHCDTKFAKKSDKKNRRP